MYNQNPITNRAADSGRKAKSKTDQRPTRFFTRHGRCETNVRRSLVFSGGDRSLYAKCTSTGRISFQQTNVFAGNLKGSGSKKTNKATASALSPGSHLSDATLSATPTALILRGCVQIMLHFPPSPLSMRLSRTNWGTCVVFPHPVSPLRTTTCSCGHHTKT